MTPPTSTSTRRAIFLDVDGTYAEHGIVPDGHVAAVRAVRAAGHLVFICTGRPKSMLPPRILAAGFDGVVAAAGGYAEVDGQILTDRRFPAPLAARLVALLDAHDVAYLLEAPEAVYGPLGVDQRLAELLPKRPREPDASPESRTARESREAQGAAPIDILQRLRMSAHLSDTSFGKVTCFHSPVPVTALADEIGPDVSAIPSSIPGMGHSAGEIYLTGIHKAIGIQVVAEHLGIEQADVVAVGDGLNDVEMLQYAGVGIAIEGAPDDVLAVADRTTPGPDREGLVSAFTQLGLL